MICQRCLFRETRHFLLTTPMRKQAPPSLKSTTQYMQRSLATTPSSSSPPATTPAAAAPAATSATGSTTTPSQSPPSRTKTPPTSNPTPNKPLSSCRAGTPLRGLNYFKNKSDPIALEDSEYPAWLWNVLPNSSNSKDASAGAGKKSDSDSLAGIDAMLYAKSDSARRLARKRLRKHALRESASGAQRVPLHEQSVDLPVPESSLEAVQVRAELTRALRQRRRATIKEANLLSGMR